MHNLTLILAVCGGAVLVGVVWLAMRSDLRAKPNAEAKEAAPPEPQPGAATGNTAPPPSDPDDWKTRYADLFAELDALLASDADRKALFDWFDHVDQKIKDARVRPELLRRVAHVYFPRFLGGDPIAFNHLGLIGQSEMPMGVIELMQTWARQSGYPVELVKVLDAWVSNKETDIDYNPNTYHYNEVSDLVPPADAEASLRFLQTDPPAELIRLWLLFRLHRQTEDAPARRAMAEALRDRALSGNAQAAAMLGMFRDAFTTEEIIALKAAFSGDEALQNAVIWCEATLRGRANLENMGWERHDLTIARLSKGLSELARQDAQQAGRPEIAQALAEAQAKTSDAAGPLARQIERLRPSEIADYLYNESGPQGIKLCPGDYIDHPNDNVAAAALNRFYGDLEDDGFYRDVKRFDRATLRARIAEAEGRVGHMVSPPDTF